MWLVLNYIVALTIIMLLKLKCFVLLIVISTDGISIILQIILSNLIVSVRLFNRIISTFVVSISIFCTNYHFMWSVFHCSLISWLLYPPISERDYIFHQVKKSIHQDFVDKDWNVALLFIEVVCRGFLSRLVRYFKQTIGLKPGQLKKATNEIGCSNWN